MAMSATTKHHPSCKPGDRALIFKCSQCGLEESGEQHTAADIELYEEMDAWRARATRADEDLLRCIDSKPALIARINELEAQAAKDLKGGALQALMYLAEVERADQAEAKLLELQDKFESLRIFASVLQEQEGRAADGNLTRAEEAERKLANLQHRYEFELGYDMGLELKVEELKEMLDATQVEREAMSRANQKLAARNKPLELHLLTDDELENQVTIHNNMLYEIKNEQELRVAMRQDERTNLQLKMDLGG
jgi:hypothetical protein